jgi:hypothetical protein
VAWKVKAIVSPDEPGPTCVVLDVSAGGARLSIPQDCHLPDRFSLYLPLRKETHEVQVRWRDNEASELGVAFVSPQASGGQGPEVEHAVQIAQLQAHIEHLQEQLQKTDNRVATLMDRVTRLEFP